MTVGAVALRRAAAVATLAAGVALVVLSSADAASDVRVTAIDCAGHPRKVAIQNHGDTAQDLAGWKLLSDKPSEVFDLNVAGTLAPGVNMYVFNGHLAPPAPQQIGSEWIYPWNYTEVYDESAFVLSENGTDFIRLVNAAGRQVSAMPCPGTLEIPPLPEPTPTQPPQPSGGNPGGGPTEQPQGNQPDGTQQGGAVQNVPSANTGVSSGTRNTAQGAATSGEVFGPPAPPGAVPISGGPPLSDASPALTLLSVLLGAALTAGGLLMIRLALRRR